MFRQPLSRTTGFAVFVATVFLLPKASEAASTDCDRNCLRQVLDAYMEGVFKHDPATAPLAENYQATENSATVLKGDGAWKSVTGYGDLQRRVFDTSNQTAAYLGLVKKDGKDQIVSLRLKVDSRKVSEAEWIFGYRGPPGGRGEPNPAGLASNPPPDAILPVAERTSRFMLKSIASSYLQAVREHDGSWVPRTADCFRSENGAARTQCLVNFDRTRLTLKDFVLQRLPIVDEEAGVVMGSGVFLHFSGENYLVHEYFAVRDGKVAGAWLFLHYFPVGAPVTTGWD